MKTKFILLLVCTCALLASCTTQSRADRIRNQLLTCDESSVMVVAHRADWRNFPENSLEAIQSAIEMGVDIVELDVQRTKDGVLMMMHDHNLDRTTTGKGNIEETEWEYISKLKLKDYKGEITDYKVPTLEQVLLLCKGRIMINLDKADRYFDEVFTLLEKTGTTDLIIMKGNLPANEVKQKYGKYLTKVIYMPKVRINEIESEQIIQECLDILKPVAFEFGYDNEKSPIPVKMKTALKGKSLKWYNTLWGSQSANHHDDLALKDPDGIYGFLTDSLGARILQTDRPQFMLEYLRSRNLHE